MLCKSVFNHSEVIGGHQKEFVNAKGDIDLYIELLRERGAKATCRPKHNLVVARAW